MHTIMKLDDFIAFARTKPADEFYNPHDGNSCALAQFLAHQYPGITFPGLSVGYYAAEDDNENSYAFSTLEYDPVLGKFERDIMDAITKWQSTTWGALAARLAAIKQPTFA